MTKLQLRPHAVLFYGLWLFIILVSVIDGYLVVRHRDKILVFERNPVGRALIKLNDGRVWFLLLAKFIGTVAACAALLLLRRWREHVGLTVAIAVAVVQLFLLLFLICA